MNHSHPLDSLTFLSSTQIPHALLHALGDFLLDTTIPLPASLSESKNEITVEAILSGILLLCAYDSKNKNIPYYKKILLCVRTDIKRELIEASILKTRNEDFEVAEEICRALIALEPQDPAIELNYALLLDAKGEYYRKSGLYEDADACDDEALQYYTQAMNNDIPDAHFNAAAFFFRKQDFTQAKDCFEAYLALVQGMSEELLGESGEKKIDRALECINFIDLQNLDDAQFKKANMLISNGEEEKGIYIIREFLESHSGVWNAWFLLGWGLRLWNDTTMHARLFCKLLLVRAGKLSMYTTNLQFAL